MAVQGFCHGHEYPDAGITPVGFSEWESYNLIGGTPSHVQGDADWGQIEQPYNDQDVSPVMDTGLTVETTFTIRHSYYGSYTYYGRLWIRGDTTTFDMQASDAELAWEEITTSTITKTWRYVQFRADNIVPPTPTPTPTPTHKPTLQ